MATEATWQRTNATMTMEHYRAMCVRYYRDDTATRMQWISRMQLQPVELFADVGRVAGGGLSEIEMSSVSAYFENFTSAPSAFRLGGVQLHLDQVIGRFSPDASIPRLVSIIRQSPEMSHRLVSSRVLVIDDGKHLFS